jgi:hypothetical protein
MTNVSSHNNRSLFLIALSITENRGEFLEKLQRARAAVRQGTPCPILSSPGPLRIVVGNWVLNSQKENHLHINNSEGHQVEFRFLSLSLSP